MSVEWKHASWVSFLGMIAWILGIISGVVNLIWGILTLPFTPIPIFGAALIATAVWLIISGIIAILISFFIILPKFSRKCQKKDWEALLNWSFNMGGINFPWMLFWGIMLEIFSYGWGGFLVIILSLVLLFAGPREYKWK
ncbi:MAG: hypothetical protein ACFFD7_14340 [Candidatus Thorarchaeota archaeon]